MLDFEYREYTKFQFNWPISFRDFDFLINFNVQIWKRIEIKHSTASHAGSDGSMSASGWAGSIQGGVVNFL